MRAGHFVVPGTAIGRVYRCEPLSEDLEIESLEDFVVTGPIRTSVQDPEYPITQLIQLTARALSPGINDPGTAITCIDWFSLSLARIVDCELPGCVFEDDEGFARLLVSCSTFAGILKAVYAPLRQFAMTDVAVSVRLVESLARLAELTSRTDRLELLMMHGDMILDGFADKQADPRDLSDLSRRHRRLRALTSRAKL